MNRLLTILSAAVSIAASSGSVSGGPAFDDGDRDVFGRRVDDSRSVRSAFDATATTAVQRAASVTSSSPELFTAADPDVSDFISSDWKRDVVEPDALSLSPDGTAANPLSPGPLVASPDAAGLSVLQIPLPDALLPGLVGVAMAFVAHRRSLHGRKLS